MKQSPKRAWPQRKLRLPPDLLAHLETLAASRRQVLEDVVADQVRRGLGIPAGLDAAHALPPSALLLGQAVARVAALAMEATGGHPWSDAVTRAEVGRVLMAWGADLAHGQPEDGPHRVLEAVTRLAAMSEEAFAGMRAGLFRPADAS